MKTYECSIISKSYILRVEFEGKSREIRATWEAPTSWTIVYEDNLEEVEEELKDEIIYKIVFWSFFNLIPDDKILNHFSQ